MHNWNFSWPSAEVQNSHFIQFTTYGPILHLPWTTPSYINISSTSFHYSCCVLSCINPLFSLQPFRLFPFLFISAIILVKLFSCSPHPLILFPHSLFRSAEVRCRFCSSPDLWGFFRGTSCVVRKAWILHTNTVLSILAPRACCPLATTSTSENSSAFRHSS